MQMVGLAQSGRRLTERPSRDLTDDRLDSCVKPDISTVDRSRDKILLERYLNLVIFVTDFRDYECFGGSVRTPKRMMAHKDILHPALFRGGYLLHGPKEIAMKCDLRRSLGCLCGLRVNVA